MTILGNTTKYYPPFYGLTLESGIMVNNYLCNSLDGEEVLVTFDERLSQIRILKKGQRITFLDIKDEFNGSVE